MKSAERKSDHIVLCGLDELGYSTLEELRRLGEEVVVISPHQSDIFSEEALGLGATFVKGNYRQESVLTEAGIYRARALVIAETDDVANIHAALTAQEINPRLRIVLRMFSQDLGHSIERLFHDCVVLSASAIAAPAFVSAALHLDSDQRIEIAGRLLSVKSCPPGTAHVLLPLANRESDGGVTLFPEHGDDMLCLVDSGAAPGEGGKKGAGQLLHSGTRSSIAERFANFWSLLVGTDRRIRIIFLALFALVVLSVLIFFFFGNLDLLDAVYFTVTIITTTGFGDINLRNAPAELEIYGMILMLLGAATLTLLYAFLTDAIVGARLTRTLGVSTRKLQGHIIICGLGSVGYRMVEQIVKAGVPVAATELRETGEFIPAAKRLGVPVFVADARTPATLQAMNITEARCLVVATDDDIANLETALTARSLNPGLRVVLRLYDTDLAARVERAFGIHLSRSVAGLAGPAFAAAAMGRRIVATIPVRGQTLILTQTRIAEGSLLVGATVAEFEAESEVRILMLRSGDEQEWRPAPQTVFLAGQEIVAVSNRRGLTQVLISTGTDLR